MWGWIYVCEKPKLIILSTTELLLIKIKKIKNWLTGEGENLLVYRESKRKEFCSLLEDRVFVSKLFKKYRE